MKSKTQNVELRLQELLSQIEPVDQLKSHNKMLVAAWLQDYLKAKCITKVQLADRMHKRPSEITKWLSGTHNFTIETLSEICFNLDISVKDLLDEQAFESSRNKELRYHLKKPMPIIPEVTLETSQFKKPATKTIRKQFKLPQFSFNVPMKPLTMGDSSPHAKQSLEAACN